jgi:hypothetical protein
MSCPRHQRILRVQSKAHDFVGFRAVSAYFNGAIHRLIGPFYRDLLNLAYAAYAGWRDASGPHAPPLRQRLGPTWRCIGQPYACPMQLPYSTGFEG